MSKKNNDIAKKLELYKNLVRNKKNVTTSPILLIEKSVHDRWLKNRIPATVVRKTWKIEFMVQQQKYNLAHYSFQLRCIDLTDFPFYRFESDGPAHRNKHLKGTLKDQQVSTPHFNTFDELGNNVAYHNAALKKKDLILRLRSNINIGSEIFCRETNVRLNKTDFPVVEFKKKELQFPATEYDPNHSVNFSL